MTDQFASYVSLGLAPPLESVAALRPGTRIRVPFLGWFGLVVRHDLPGRRSYMTRDGSLREWEVPEATQVEVLAPL